MTRLRRRPQLHFTISVLFFLALSGCIPTKFRGYFASGAGTLESRYCGGLGIKDVLRVQAISGVLIEIRANQNQSNHTLTLDISLTVPETVTVQLLSPELVLQSREWEQPLILPIDRIMGSGPKPGPNRYRPTDRLIGSYGSPGLFGFWFLKGDKGTLFQTDLPKVDSFTLQFPPLKINEQMYYMDTIKFDTYAKWSIYTCVQ